MEIRSNNLNGQGRGIDATERSREGMRDQAHRSVLEAREELQRLTRLQSERLGQEGAATEVRHRDTLDISEPVRRDGTGGPQRPQGDGRDSFELSDRGRELASGAAPDGERAEKLRLQAQFREDRVAQIRADHQAAQQAHKAERIAQIRADHQAGTLNTDERMTLAAERMLGGQHEA